MASVLERPLELTRIRFPWRRAPETDGLLGHRNGWLWHFPGSFALPVAGARTIVAVVLTALVCLLLVLPAREARAASAKEIDIEVNAALARFRKEVHGGAAYLEAAKGVLVFPDVLKAGIGVGAEYGEGALRVGGRTVDYYSTAAASIGLQWGIQSKAVFLLFMDRRALADFRRSHGWEIGVDGSVAIVQVGAGGKVDTTNITDPVVGFVLTNKGLMFNLTLEGSKLTRLRK